MNTENKKYIDRIKRGEELDDGSKEVPRTAPSSLDSSKLSSLFVVNVCMRVWIMWMCVSDSLFFEWVCKLSIYRVNFELPFGWWSTLLLAAPNCSSWPILGCPCLSAHAWLPMLAWPCLSTHACLPMLACSWQIHVWLPMLGTWL